MDFKEEIPALAEKMKCLLETFLLQPPPVAADAMEEVSRIRALFSSYGYLVTWDAALDPSTLDVSVEITVFAPKDDLTPESQAIYDAWFLKSRGENSHAE